MPNMKHTVHTFMAFMASAPKLWNRLPSNIRAVNDLNCFKTLLKTHLFRQAFLCLLL